MSRLIRLVALAAALVLSATAFQFGVTAPSAPVFARIDHVYASSPNAESMFTVLHDSHGLPAAWPFKRYVGFASGAVWVGNVALEFVTSGRARGDLAPTRWESIAFAPVGHTDDMIAELARRGTRYAKPDSAFLTDSTGASVHAWTNTDLTDLPPTNIAFVCDYIDRARNRAGRRAAQDSLIALGGGPLGVVAVREIVVGVDDLPRATAQWRRLADAPSTDSPDVVRFGDGPAVRLRSATRTGILEIVIAVRSLPAARRALADRGLLEPDETGAVVVSARAMRGLRVRLVDP